MVSRFVFGEGHPAIDYLLLLAIVDDREGDGLRGNATLRQVVAEANLAMQAVFTPGCDPGVGVCPVVQVSEFQQSCHRIGDHVVFETGAGQSGSHLLHGMRA